MFWSEIAFMLFPTQVCPACEKRRVTSRSVYLCSTCEEKAHTFTSERKKYAPSPSSPGGIVSSSTKGASGHTLRPEVLAFMSAAETVLSPAVLISPLNDDERGIIQIYLKNLEDLVMEGKATSSASR
jgi:hypothetical protein